MSTDSLLGKQFDEYRIDQPLGSGGMARVYRALDTRLKRYVALKVIAPGYRMDAEYTKRFEREAQSIARLDHPNIVRLYRFGEADGLLYMAMQYLDGADLGSLIEDYKADSEVMAIDDVVRIITDIGAALDYAHSQGVIHRDVKPGNIMLDKRGQAYLTDFGLALLDDVGTRGEIFGSPHYIAPEQAISSANVVPQTDLYALGVTLFEMLTGDLPFQDDEPTAVAMLHMSEAPPAPSQFNTAIPASIDQVVLHALEKEVADRYQTGKDLSAALMRAVQSWRPNSLPEEAASHRPSLVTVPSKVSDLIAHSPLPVLPPLPAERTKPAEPASAAPTQIHPKRTDWKYPLLFAGAVFFLGLVVVVAILLAGRNNVGVAGAPTPTASLTLTVVPITPAITLTPTFTTTPLPTPTALVLLITPVASTPVPSAAPSSVVIAPSPLSSSVSSATPGSVVIAPSPASSTVPNITTTAETPLTLTFSSDRNWFAVANSSSVAIPLQNIGFSQQTVPLNNSVWNVASLNPGDCLRIYHDDKPPQTLPTGCNHAIDYPGSKPERDPWFKADQVVAITWSGETPFFILSFHGDRHLFAVENASSSLVPIRNLIFLRLGRTLSSSDWGVSALKPGDCLRLNKDNKLPPNLVISCANPIDYNGSKPDRDFWFKDDGMLTIVLVARSGAGS